MCSSQLYRLYLLVVHDFDVMLWQKIFKNRSRHFVYYDEFLWNTPPPFLSFYAVSWLPLSLIQGSPTIMNKGWNFSQLWNTYPLFFFYFRICLALALVKMNDKTHRNVPSFLFLLSLFFDTYISYARYPYILVIRINTW